MRGDALHGLVARALAPLVHVHGVAVDLDAALAQHCHERADEVLGRVDDGERLGLGAAGRDGDGHREVVGAEAAAVALAHSPAVGGDALVGDGDEAADFRLHGDARRVAGRGAADAHLDGALVELEAGGLGAVRPHQVVPAPPFAQAHVVEHVVVSDHRSGDAADAAGLQAVRPLPEGLREVAAGVAPAEGGVAGAADHEGALEGAAAALAVGVEARGVAEVRAERVQGRGRGDQFHVGRRDKAAVRVALEQRLAGRQVDHLGAPVGVRERAVVQHAVDLLG